MREYSDRFVREVVLYREGETDASENERDDASAASEEEDGAEDIQDNVGSGGASETVVETNDVVALEGTIDPVAETDNVGTELQQGVEATEPAKEMEDVGKTGPEAQEMVVVTPEPCQPSVVANANVKEEAWYDGCRYGCGLCDYTARDPSAIPRHTLHHHHKEQGGQGTIRTLRQSTIECYLCNSVVRRSKGTILRHLNIVHRKKVTFEEFGVRYAQGAASEKTEVTPRNDIENAEAEALDEVKEPTVDKGAGPDPKSKVRPWYDGCSYQCSHCVFATHSENTLYSHKKSLHTPSEPRVLDSEIVARETRVEPTINKAAVLDLKMKARPWYDGCSYQCSHCAFATHSENTLYSHKKSLHAPSEPRVLDSEMIARETFACDECGMSMLHTRKKISHHLAYTHKMSVNQYGSRHMEKATNSEGGEAPSKKKLRNRTDHDDEQRPEVEAVRAKHQASMPPWYDGCKFRCLDCGLTAHSESTMFSHKRKRHRTSATVGPNCDTVVEVDYTCRECGQVMTHKYNKIKAHLKAAHEMSMQAYAKKHHSTEKRESAEQVQASLEDGKEKQIRTVELKNQECRSAGAGGGKAWFDGCLYKCRFCPKKSEESGAMHRHVRSSHKKAAAKYEIKGCYTALRKSSINCGMCSLTLPRTSFSIRRHLTMSHGGMTLEEYGDR